MMLSTRLVCTLVVCVTIGAVVMALPAPQFRFGMPAHFSFRTVHTPFQPGQQPSQAPNTFFFSQPRLTSMATKAFNQRQSSPALTEETHVPVFVPVQNDFQGDSVVVSSADLVNMGLTGALENTDGAVDPAPAVMDEGTPVEELSLAPVADIQTDLLDAVTFEESAVGPLSIADDAFVLTASEAQPEPVDLVSPVDSVIESEVILQEVQPVEPVVLQTFNPTTTVSPFQTETFKAYNDYMNTWIQLASVNLNRPDLLKLLNVLPTVSTPQPLIQAQSEPQVLEIQEIVVPEAQQELVEQVEVVQPVEVVEDLPVVEETLPVETVTESFTFDFTPSDVTTEVPFAEVTTEVAGDIIAEEVTQVAETIPEVTFENFQPEVVEPTAVISETLPEATFENTQPEVVEPTAVFSETLPETTFENLQPEVVEPTAVISETLPEATFENTQPEVVEPATAVVEQDIFSNIIPDTPVQPSAIPAHFNTIPTYTSRGRLSGFRYSFAHVPQRGTFFLNSIAG